MPTTLGFDGALLVGFSVGFLFGLLLRIFVYAKI